VEGLYAPKVRLQLPHRAYRALEQLWMFRGVLGTLQVRSSEALGLATPGKIAGTLGTLRVLTEGIEHEIHEAVLSCTRVRRTVLRGPTATNTMLH
jgi:hypothetical protein